MKTITIYTEPNRDVPPNTMSMPRLRIVLDCLHAYEPMLSSKYAELIKEIEAELALLPNGVIDYKRNPL